MESVPRRYVCLRISASFRSRLGFRPLLHAFHFYAAHPIMRYLRKIANDPEVTPPGRNGGGRNKRPATALEPTETTCAVPDSTIGGPQNEYRRTGPTTPNQCQTSSPSCAQN